MAPAEQDALTVREQLFHERVRECIICTLLFASLYILCHFIITHFKKHTDFTAVHDDEDAAVNRIALGLCTFTLAVALGAVLLLPFSIISNEVLLSFPQNYYIQWLNGSLVHGLWNLVFLFSNLSLVFLMPFAYFFTESEGFAGSKKGIMARVYETSVVLLLLTLLVLGMVWVASAIISNDAASRQSLYDLWEYYLPYLYSCISLFGVLLLLLCTPFGLSTMFTVTGKLLVKPRLLEDLDEQLSCTRFEEAAVSRRISSGKASCWLNLNMELLREQFFTIRSKRRKLELRHQASPWQRNLGYPLAMLGLLALTGISVLIVCFHVLELLLDDAAMPRGIQDASLGQVSFSIFGSFGAALQLPDGLLRRGLLQLPPLHPAAPRAAGHSSHQDHRELRLLAGAQLGPARLLQDAGDHPFRPPGGLWPLQLAGELLHCLPLQHGLRRAHHPVPGEEGLLGSPGRAHPRLRSAQAAAAHDVLPTARQALLGLGDVSSPTAVAPRTGLPAAELAPTAPGASELPETPRESRDPVGFPAPPAPQGLSQPVALLSLGLEPRPRYSPPRAVGSPRGCAGCGPPMPRLYTSCESSRPRCCPGCSLGYGWVLDVPPPWGLS
ncbi:protein LMBR1L isoform X2 [Balearica regulorum gibbericeps]|uniref:protein LMBR1L isoform X2 n=1 Tax=Balearica regulorum gibbericeps TaxID=100784 RepID=UPI003F5D9F1A